MASHHMDAGGGLLCLDSVTDYEKLHRIGEGTYGVVYKARHRRTGQLCALKKVRFDRAKDGVPVTSIRELRVLQECKHPNIVRLIKVVTGSKPDSVFLVFEYCEYDLGRVLDRMPQPFTLPQIKQLMLQLLDAVMCLHRHWVLHRDIKMSNLLYCKTGQLKLCDLGLARYFQHQQTAMTPNVVTLWYRAPELLLGEEKYGESVDMWAVGCVLGELLQHRPLFPASSEVQALSMQVELLGAPTKHTWPGMMELPHANKFKMPSQPQNRLHTITAPHRPYSASHQQPHRGFEDGAWHRGRRHDSPLSPERWRPSSTSPKVGNRHNSRSRSPSRSRSRSPGARRGRPICRDARGRPADTHGRGHGRSAEQSPTRRSHSRSRSSYANGHSHHRRSPARQYSESPDPGRQHLQGQARYNRSSPGRRTSSHGGHASNMPSHSYIQTDLALDLLSQLLAWDPHARLSAAEARAHPWFQEPPLACPLATMPRSPIREEQAEQHPHQHHTGQQQHPHRSRQQAGEMLRPGLMVDHTAEQQRRLGDMFGGGGDANQRRMVLRRC